jgi:hypothetical protein
MLGRRSTRVDIDTAHALSSRARRRPRWRGFGVLWQIGNRARVFRAVSAIAHRPLRAPRAAQQMRRRGVANVVEANLRRDAGAAPPGRMPCTVDGESAQPQPAMHSAGVSRRTGVALARVHECRRRTGSRFCYGACLDAAGSGMQERHLIVRFASTRARRAVFLASARLGSSIPACASSGVRPPSGSRGTSAL